MMTLSPPSRLRAPLSGLVLCLVLAVVASCSGQPSGTEGAAGEKAATGAPGDGLAFDFSLSNLAGETVNLSDSAGRVRLIDFWATWCAPCREEIPMLNDLHATYGEQGLTILAISDPDEGADVVGPFAKEHETIYVNLLGTDEIYSQYQVFGMPTAYLVDGEGRIVEMFVGAKPRKVLEGKIRALLELPPLT